eukprot:1194692-Prorocentrum_minimum.AAC.2
MRGDCGEEAERGAAKALEEHVHRHDVGAGGEAVGGGHRGQDAVLAHAQREGFGGLARPHLLPARADRHALGSDPHTDGASALQESIAPRRVFAARVDPRARLSLRGGI